MTTGIMNMCNKHQVTGNDNKICIQQEQQRHNKPLINSMYT